MLPSETAAQAMQPEILSLLFTAQPPLVQDKDLVPHAPGREGVAINGRWLLHMSVAASYVLYYLGSVVFGMFQ
jgi:hypothetical protein